MCGLNQVQQSCAIIGATEICVFAETLYISANRLNKSVVAKYIHEPAQALFSAYINYPDMRISQYFYSTTVVGRDTSTVYSSERSNYY